MRTWAFVAALFIVTKRWNSNKCLLTEEWSNKFWFIHTTVIKKNELELYILTLEEFHEQLWNKTKFKTLYVLLSHFKNNEEKSSPSVYMHAGKYLCNEHYLCTRTGVQWKSQTLSCCQNCAGGKEGSWEGQQEKTSLKQKEKF